MKIFPLMLKMCKERHSLKILGGLFFFIFASCLPVTQNFEEEKESFPLVGNWNVLSVKGFNNKNCTVEIDTTDDDLSDIIEWSGTMTFTDSTATSNYVYSIKFQKYCDNLGGTMIDTTCTVESEGVSVEMTEKMFSEEICLKIDDNANYSDGKCNIPELFIFNYTLNGNEFCELDDASDTPHCGTAEVTETSATITMPDHEENECEIIELTK